MRLRLLAVVGGSLWMAASAQANTIVFGSAIDNSSCSLSGNSGDRSCSYSISVNDGALDETASLQIVGQASADHGITTNPTAIADLTVSYTIPYTVTRTVTVVPGAEPGANAVLSIPIQLIRLTLNYSGSVAKDNSQVGGGLGQALATAATFTSASLPDATIGGTRQVTGGGGLERIPWDATIPFIGTTLGRNAGGPGAGEISFVFEIPTSYQDWEDFDEPFAIDYSVGGTFTQTFTDALTISFRLRAESRPSGSVSTTGGEAIACAGQKSPLDGFDLDDGTNCGSGLTITATVTQTGVTIEDVSGVPEPGTLLLMGLGIAGLFAASGRRVS
ncbi:MAG TPA: PEP-CTERM sorting domain-containing protein [Myxococcota bacterium]